MCERSVSASPFRNVGNSISTRKRNAIDCIKIARWQWNSTHRPITATAPRTIAAASAGTTQYTKYNTVFDVPFSFETETEHKNWIPYTRMLLLRHTHRHKRMLSSSHAQLAFAKQEFFFFSALRLAWFPVPCKPRGIYWYRACVHVHTLHSSPEKCYSGMRRGKGKKEGERGWWTGLVTNDTIADAPKNQNESRVQIPRSRARPFRNRWNSIHADGTKHTQHSSVSVFHVVVVIGCHRHCGTRQPKCKLIPPAAILINAILSENVCIIFMMSFTGTSPASVAHRNTDVVWFLFVLFFSVSVEFVFVLFLPVLIVRFVAIYTIPGNVRISTFGDNIPTHHIAMATVRVHFVKHTHTPTHINVTFQSPNDNNAKHNTTNDQCNGNAQFRRINRGTDEREKWWTNRIWVAIYFVAFALLSNKLRIVAASPISVGPFIRLFVFN